MAPIEERIRERQAAYKPGPTEGPCWSQRLCLAEQQRRATKDALVLQRRATAESFGLELRGGAEWELLVQAAHKGGAPQLEAAHCLAERCAEPAQARSLVASGALPLLAALLHSDSEPVREQVFLALGALAAADPELRALVLRNGAIDLARRALSSGSCIRSAAFALGHLCAADGQGSAAAALEALEPLLAAELEPRALAEVCAAVARVAAGPAGFAAAAARPEFASRLAVLCQHRDAAVSQHASQAMVTLAQQGWLADEGNPDAWQDWI